ncbi:uncharacterized protein LOC110988002 [Acanthaster planci]|uniref:Uncharacterized protein LOC110988002 n=1 Tax=Acanthaster planci TaxID=133434 RepID=A0A8B7ZNA9_ACAPL|nr:uncharacterized protein LOC110988002 [Acanthaster planci]
MPKESAITKSLSILNSEQQQAVLANPENNLLIIAGPGTGKTTVLTEHDFVDNHQRVNLMTLHGAKGLEFKHVFLFQVTEEIFPSRLNLDIEEERRLFFVGLTRAQQHLYITADFFRPSIFVQEIMQSPLVTKKDIY